MRPSLGLKPESSRRALSTLCLRVIAVCAGLFPALLLIRVILNFRNQYFLGHVDGVWLGCASDFVHGVLYRPLFGPLGYGGTRYFPLYFVATGGLSGLFGGLENSGLVLSAISIILLLCACYVLLRRINVGVQLSLAAAVAVCAVTTTQQALLQTRGDGMAAMLNLWGLTLCVSDKPKRAHLYLAATLFTLAFATKVTTIFGLAAVLIAWLLARRYKKVLQLGVATLAGYAAVLAAIYAGSNGRAFGIFRACAASGVSLRLALRAPLQMLSVAFQFDRVMLLFLIAAIVLGMRSFKLDDDTQILGIYFVLVLLATVAIFSSPGITNNHLLDLHVAAVLLLVVAIARNPAIAATGIRVLAILLVIGCGATIARTVHDTRRPSLRRNVQQLKELLPEGGRPVLAENSVVVLELGERPYLLDPWMFRVLTERDPAFGTDVWERLSHLDFSAVVLERDPNTARGEEWYRNINLGSEFLSKVEANYSFSYQLGDMYVYTPR